MEGFVQYGSWILIDPDERHIDLIEETIDLENLCDLLRCDSTDLLNLGDSYLGFVDGEGAGTFPIDKTKIAVAEIEQIG